jgi:hypothetical protein
MKGFAIVATYKGTRDCESRSQSHFAVPLP